MAKTGNLSTIHKKLVELHGVVEGPGVEDPFQLILWEQVAYLADDERRRRAFEELERRVGLTPEAILQADPEVLNEVTASGSRIASETRAARMRESARRVLGEWGGDLQNALRLPQAEAVRALKKFPMIGKPGAEKILLLAKAYPLLAPDSNALRVLVRLGYGQEGARYDQTYENVRAATQDGLGTDFSRLISLRELLRCHGQQVCRHKMPRCSECPLTEECAFFTSGKTSPDS